MTSARIWRGLAVLLAVSMAAADASAWGPQAQRSIMQTALQLVRREYSQQYYREGEFAFETDLVQGAQDGWSSALGLELRDPEDAINAVHSQIRLMRYVRTYGVGDYFGYRMGVLGSLVADLYLPLAITEDQSPQTREIRRRIQDDIDEHLATLRYQGGRPGLNYIRSPKDYFDQANRFSPDVVFIVSSDYTGRSGFDGYLKNGASAHFSRAVLAVADTFHTVLRDASDAYDQEPSREAATWYFVDEIRYLLLVKDDPEQAEKAYQRFTSVNPGIIPAYERVGDYFYESGDRERGVQEWRVASTFSGPERKRIIRKLAGYYVEVGRENLALADRPGDPERYVDAAVRAFTDALSVDRTSREAGDLLAHAQEVRKEMRQEMATNLDLVASSETLLEQANNAFNERIYEEAITSAQRAATLAESVSGRFTKIAAQAREIAADAEALVSRTLDQVLEDAQDAIDDGQRMIDENLFEEAKLKLGGVEGMLTVIGDEDSLHAEQKAELITRAKELIDEADRARRRWEEEQRQRREAAEQQSAQGQAGGGAGQAAPAAPAAPSGPQGMPMMPPMMPMMPPGGGGMPGPGGAGGGN